MNLNNRFIFNRPGVGFFSLNLFIILVLTLTPYQEWLGQNRIDFCILCKTSAIPDALGNVLLFFPLGIAFAFRGYSLYPSIFFGMLLSLAIEISQFFIPGRDPSLQDIICNSLGTFLGFRFLGTYLGSPLTGAIYWCREFWEQCKRPHPYLANALLYGATFVAVSIFGLTTWLLAPTFPEGPYFFAGKEMDSGSTPLRIGASGDGIGYYKGAIDEVRIYNRVLTPGEIQADMVRPLDAASPNPLPGLVAAYGFEEKSGDRILDLSGQGNDGLLDGAVRVTGRFGRALVFNGRNDQVIIPHAPMLNLGTHSTLEAWARPEVNRSGWPTVIQKKGDHYFLYTGPDLAPGGGGTFGGVFESFQVAERIPEKVWTHLAMTYDGSALQIYINGRQVASFVRWFQGRIDEISVGNIAVHPASSTDTSGLRLALRRGEIIRLRGVTGPVVSNQGALLDIRNMHRDHILRLGASGDDLILRYLTVATSLDLPSPEIRISGALRNIPTEYPLHVELTGTSSNGRSLSVNGVAYQRLGFTLGMGWTVLLYSEYLPPRLREFFNLAWIAAWAFPVGFWLRMGIASLGAVVIFAGSLWILPFTGVFLPTPSIQWTAFVLGLLTGIGVHLQLCSKRRAYK